MNAQLILQQFHFLRPEWLLAIIPAAILALFFWQQRSSAVNWRGAINPQLLDHLIDGGSTKVARWPWLLLLLAWLIASIAMAGPTWTKLPQPIHKKQDALVIVLDLSLSMLAEDIKPSRLVRARHKVLDILSQRDEGLTALIAYSGDAHIVSPLTDDNPTIANLTPALAPGMMPVFGSDPVAAIKLARKLFKNAGASNGRVLLITDGVTKSDVDDIDDLLSRSGYELSIMGVGTPDGAPIPAQSGFLKDNSGNIIVPQLQRSRLEQLAKQNNGRYTDISFSDNDVSFLLPKLTTELEDNTVLTEREFDQWHDRGPMLALVLLPRALLAFRRGWLLMLPLLLLVQPQSSQAFEWQDLWQRADQQAAKALESGDAKTAAKLFKDEQWQASANYQAGDFKNAAQQFSKQDNATGHYNRGNSLAKAGELDKAIDAYSKALEQTPGMEDAVFNKQLLEQLKQQQEQQEQQPSDDEKSDEEKEDGEQQDQDGEPQDGDQQKSDQESDQDQQGDNQEQDEQDQDPDNSDEQNEEEPEEEKQQREQQQAEQEEKEQEQAEQQQAQASEQDEQSPEEKQAMEQWLRKIPDDPSGLLRRKFNHESKVRQQQGESQREQPQW
jgi:Ca-activated chloride channel family protein